MFLSQQDAQSIVDQAKEAIGRDINIMDGDGRILASTNPARQGQLHPGAARVLREGLSFLTVEADQAGMQAGINLPVRLDGRTVGVIGITGPPAEVSAFGSVIKHLTELLVERARGLFVETWLFSREPDWAELEVRGRLLGFALEEPYTVALLRLPRPALSGSVEDLGEMRSSLILGMLRTRLRQDSRHACAVIRDQVILLLCGLDRTQALAAVRQACRDVEGYYGVPVRGGISSPSRSPSDIRRCYLEARTAGVAAEQSDRSRLVFYDEVSLEFLVQSIPRKLRQDLREVLFSGCTDQEKRDFSRLILLYFQQGGDIRRCAEELFIHRNTFQYRVEVLAKRTGRDLRRPKDATLLYLAALEV